jgi:hypothetical protein
MSLDKANSHIDTSLWFFSPRAYTALKLSEVVCSCDGIAHDPQVINDFECNRNFNFGAGADKLTIVNNPYQVAENLSIKVGVYLDPPNDPWAALCVDFEDPVDLSVYNQFEFQVNTNTSGPILVKLEGGSSSAYETWLDVSGSGEWETLTADLSSQAAANHTRLCLFPNGGVEQPSEDVYWLDNLRLNMSTGTSKADITSLLISPNPAQDIVHVRNSVQASYVTVVNILGQQVMKQSSNHHEIVTLLLGDLSPGIYIIGAYSAESKLIAHARIMKN